MQLKITKKVLTINPNALIIHLQVRFLSSIELIGGVNMKVCKNKIEYFSSLKGWTGKQTAENAGMKPQAFSLVKTRGTCRPETAKKIATALGVDIRDIMKGEE